GRRARSADGGRSDLPVPRELSADSPSRVAGTNEGARSEMDRKAEDVKTLSRLTVSARMRAPADRVFDLLTDVGARVGQGAAYKKVEVTDRTADGFIARFHEHYGGRDLVILSHF